MTDRVCAGGRAVAVMRKGGVMVLPRRAAGADVDGRVDQLRNVVHQPMMCICGDRVTVHHAESRVDDDAGLGPQAVADPAKVHPFDGRVPDPRMPGEGPPVGGRSPRLPVRVVCGGVKADNPSVGPVYDRAAPSELASLCDDESAQWHGSPCR